MGKMIVITPIEEIFIKDYKGYDSVRETVMGYVESVIVPEWIRDIFNKAPNPEMKDIVCHYLCNESGYYSPTGYDEKVNAMVSMMYEPGPIFGAVAVVRLADVPVFEDGELAYMEQDDVGFTDEEAEFLKNTLEVLFADKKNDLAAFHETYDDAKKRLMAELNNQSSKDEIDD